MVTKKTFDDGSSVEWVDKETLKYVEGDFSVIVWVDFEPLPGPSGVGPRQVVDYPVITSQR